MNPISQRLLNQQLICPQFTTPYDVVAWMGAMQAQEYRMMRWAVGMRTKQPCAKAFEKAYNEGKNSQGTPVPHHLAAGDRRRLGMDARTLPGQCPEGDGRMDAL